MADDIARLEQRITGLDAKLSAMRAAFDGLLEALDHEAPAVRTRIIDYLQEHQRLSFARHLDQVGAEIGRILPTNG